MTIPKKRKTLKIVLISTSIVLLIAAIATIWVSSHYKGIIRQNLPGWVADASDSLYKVSYSDISINLISNKITLENAHIWADSERLHYLQSIGMAPDMVFNMDIPAATVKGIQLKALVGTKELVCNTLYFDKPKITITAIAQDSVAAPTEKKKGNIEKIGAGRIEIHDADMVYEDHRTSNSNTYYVKGGNIAFTDWYIMPGNEDSKRKKLQGKLGNLEIDSLGYATSTGYYAMQCGHISIKDKKTTIKDFRLQPLYNKQDFYKKAGHQKEIYTLHFPLITLQDFEPETMINENRLEASLVRLKDASINIYFSRVPPANTKSKIGNYPNQIVQKFGINTYIKSVEVVNGKFRYTEKNAATMREGSFFLQDINGDVAHISNMPEHLQDNHTCTIKLSGSFMGQSTMSAIFKLDLTDTLGGFTVSGEHKNLDAAEIREMVKALAVADIKSMHANSIKFSVNANQYESDGNLTMLYDNLEVGLMKVEDDKDLKTQGLLSLIARKTLVYKANPKEGEAVRTATMHQQRRPTGSFFNLIWKTLFEGITETVLRTDGAADYVQDAGPDKKKKGIVNTVKQLFKNDKKEKKKESKK